MRNSLGTNSCVITTHNFVILDNRNKYNYDHALEINSTQVQVCDYIFVYLLMTKLKHGKFKEKDQINDLSNDIQEYTNLKFRRKEQQLIIIQLKQTLKELLIAEIENLQSLIENHQRENQIQFKKINHNKLKRFKRKLQNQMIQFILKRYRQLLKFKVMRYLDSNQKLYNQTIKIQFIKRMIEKQGEYMMINQQSV